MISKSDIIILSILLLICIAAMGSLYDMMWNSKSYYGSKAKYFGEWMEQGKEYEFMIFAESDGSYSHKIFSSICRNRTVGLANGDTLIEKQNYSPSEIEYDPEATFFGYDTSIIRIVGIHIVPRHIGMTPLLVNLPTRVDSAFVGIIERNDNLVIEPSRYLRRKDYYE